MKRVRMRSSENSLRNYKRVAKTKVTKWFKHSADWAQMTILRTFLKVTSSWHRTASYHQHFNSLPLLLRQLPTCLTHQLFFHIPRTMAARINKRNRHTLSCSANVTNFFSMTRFSRNFPRTLTIKLLHSHCACCYLLKRTPFHLFLELQTLSKLKDNQ